MGHDWLSWSRKADSKHAFQASLPKVEGLKQCWGVFQLHPDLHACQREDTSSATTGSSTAEFGTWFAHVQCEGCTTGAQFAFPVSMHWEVSLVLGEMSILT